MGCARKKGYSKNYIARVRPNSKKDVFWDICSPHFNTAINRLENIINRYLSGVDLGKFEMDIIGVSCDEEHQIKETISKYSGKVT